MRHQLKRVRCLCRRRRHRGVRHREDSEKTMKKRILSGMRPTGKLHLGHLKGALDNWVKLQEEYDCFFMVADWHALMSEYEDPSVIGSNIVDNVIDWLSAGLDPKRS